MITQESLLKSHYYNPATGLFYKRMTSGKLKLTGTSMKSGHLHCGVDRTTYLIHRLIWLYMTGVLPKEDIDHIDGNPANNKWANLREASRSDNLENLKKAKVINKSTGLLGASSNGQNGKFTAGIQVKGKRLHLGTFDTPEKAHRAYIEAKRELHLFNTL